MYPFNDYFYTEKSTKGENLCEYIIIHHTAGNTYAGNCKRLS
ncbi:hypothetical protein FACS1894176_11200 [Bacteroidia bacterium]|nr:hypothetical protein FACS1894176_11200 [Bacteroidia bacterium]